VTRSASLRETIRVAEIDLVARWLPAGGEILELGAGSGWQARELADRGFRVTALEVTGSPYLTDAVYPVQFYDGRRLPFPDNSFDAVFSSNVLEHVAELDALLIEMQRVVRSGGRAVHVMPSAAWRCLTNVTHYLYAVKVLFLLRRSGAGDGDCITDAHLRRLRAGGPQAALATALRRVLPQRHGERGNALSEVWYFSRWWWRARFQGTGWRHVATVPNRLAYSGYFVLGAALPLATRRLLSRIVGSAALIYVLDRTGANAAALAGRRRASPKETV